MENATKALLIAGSVLIALLLIAVGLRIFNSTKGTAQTAQSTMQTTEVAMFNNQFTQYINRDINKQEALELVYKVAANNASSSHHIIIWLETKDGSTGFKYDMDSEDSSYKDVNYIIKNGINNNLYWSSSAKATGKIYKQDDDGRIKDIWIKIK